MEVLIVIDVQYDFCENGSLPVKEGSLVIPVINSLRDKFQKVIFTLDWHPPAHVSFASSHENAQEFSTITVEKTNKRQELWPSHCVGGTEGANLHRDLLVKAEDVMIRKGLNEDHDSYSGFGVEEDRSDLDAVLRSYNSPRLYLCGLAFDYCVGKTALDAVSLGYETHVITDACRSISEETQTSMREKLISSGVKLVSSQDINFS